MRDLLADHWMETIETDLKHTVLLVCEDVPDLRVAADKDEDVPFLEGTQDFARLKCRLSEGDSIPRCDSTLLRVPVSQREMEKEKKSVKKAIKMKIKRFKKGGNGIQSRCGFSMDATTLTCLECVEQTS